MLDKRIARGRTFSGTIPRELGNLNSAEKVLLSENFLSGTFSTGPYFFLMLCFGRERYVEFEMWVAFRSLGVE